MDKRYSFLGAQIRSIDEENFTIEHVINTKVCDRYLTCVLPKGADVKSYMKNPVALWLHGQDKNHLEPIGRCVEMNVSDAEIAVKTQFNKSDPFAVKIFQAYKDGFMNAWSIGFMPLKYERYSEETCDKLNQKYGLNITPAQIKDAGFYGVYVIYKWELYEYSAVPVPGNPEALTDDSKKVEFKKELCIRGLVGEGESTDAFFRIYTPVSETTAQEVTAADGVSAPAPVVPVTETPVPVAIITETAPVAEELAPIVPVVSAVENPEPIAPVVEAAPGVPERDLIKELDDLKAFVYTGMREDVKTLVGGVKRMAELIAALSAEVEKLKSNKEVTEKVQALSLVVEEITKTLSVNNIDTIRTITTNDPKEYCSGVFSKILFGKNKS